MSSTPSAKTNKRAANASKKTRRTSTTGSLMVRLDQESKSYLVQAAKLRRISVSDYVRNLTVPQARREVEASKENVIVLAPEEQLAFWSALNEPPKLTPALKELGHLMRGEL